MDARLPMDSNVTKVSQVTCESEIMRMKLAIISMERKVEIFL